MKTGKEKDSTQDKVQLIKGFFRDDYGIIKRTTPDGPAYEHPIGTTLETRNEDLYHMIDRMLHNFQFISDNLNNRKDATDDDDYLLANVLNCMIQDSRCKLREIFSTVNGFIGDIEVTSLDGDNTVYRAYRCLDAQLTPPEIDAENGITYDHDPDLIELLKGLPPDRTSPLKAIVGVLKRGQSFRWYPVTSEGSVSADAP